MSTLPLSPLTVSEIHDRQSEAAWLAVCDRPSGEPSEDDVADALRHARLALEMHNAAYARVPEAQR